jgi:hypothetical protein
MSHRLSVADRGDQATEYALLDAPLFSDLISIFTRAVL